MKKMMMMLMMKKISLKNRKMCSYGKLLFQFFPKNLGDDKEKNEKISVISLEGINFTSFSGL